MHDLHTHTYNSDGVLGLAELARRCSVLGYDGLVFSDHCDCSNLDDIITRAKTFCEESDGLFGDLQILAGCELTHVPPPQIERLIARARALGAAVVLVHGETIAEPVAGGTNRSAIEAGADVLAHPGLISRAEVQLAAEKGVLLEISARKGHSLTNGHVARLALEQGCPLCFGSDGHAPGDYPDMDTARRILMGAGMTLKQAEEVMQNTAAFFDRSG